MSTLKVDTIQKADGTGSLSVPAESGTVVTTASPSLGRRNLIINGAMQVAQRGTTATGGSTALHYGGCDRWRMYQETTAAAYTLSQDSNSPNGFATSYKLDVTTADATLDAADRADLIYRFEGNELQSLAKGTSDAKQMTLSFWVSSPKTGTHIIEVVDNDNSRSISKSYTVSAADTWEHKTIVIDADTTGALDNDNALSLQISFWLMAGSNFTSGTLDTSWGAVTAANRAVGQVNVMDSTSNNFYLTGVQLEVGSVATPFEHRSYGEELALCQRYFHKLSRDYNNGIIGSGYFYGNTTCRGFIPMPTTMRSYPSVSHVSVTDVRCGYGGGSSASSAFAGLDGATRSGVWVGYTTSSGTQGHGALLYMYPQDPEISFDAEL